MWQKAKERQKQAEIGSRKWLNARTAGDLNAGSIIHQRKSQIRAIKGHGPFPVKLEICLDTKSAP